MIDKITYLSGNRLLGNKINEVIDAVESVTGVDGGQEARLLQLEQDVLTLQEDLLLVIGRIEALETPAGI